MILNNDDTKFGSDIKSAINNINKLSLLKAKIDEIVFDYNEQMFHTRIKILFLTVGEIKYLIENNLGEAYIIEYQNLKLLRKAKIESLFYD